MSRAVLEARGLGLSLGPREVLRDVSLELEPGDFTALLGANGAGKTTLLRLLLGLAHLERGEVLLDGRPLREHGRRSIARRMAYVPQTHVPSFPYTVWEIVAMGRASSAGWNGARPRLIDDLAVSEALDRLGMQGFAERSYARLSGGERQAVLIARALAQGARILLMDEPTTSLDVGQQARLMGLLLRLSRDGYAILMSTHQPELALRWSNRAILLHQGAVLGDGQPSAVLTTENLSRLYGAPVEIVEARAGAFIVASAPDGFAEAGSAQF